MFFAHQFGWTLWIRFQNVLLEKRQSSFTLAHIGKELVLLLARCCKELTNQTIACIHCYTPHGVTVFLLRSQSPLPCRSVSAP